VYAILIEYFPPYSNKLRIATIPVLDENEDAAIEAAVERLKRERGPVTVINARSTLS